MKSITKIFIFIISLSTFFSSCDCVENQGGQITKMRNLNDFSGLQVSIPADISIIKSDSSYFEVTTSEKVLKHLVFSFNDGLLNIVSDRYLCDATVKINIYANQLKKLYAYGQASINMDSGFPQTKEFKIKMSGGAYMKLNLNTEKVLISEKGEGTIVLQGKADEVDLNSKGNSLIKTVGLRSHFIDIDSKGSGQYFLDSTKRMNIELAGNSYLYYRGNPKIQSCLKENAFIQKLDN
ncbi:MAG: GIN domain-containing protein [Hyphomicrobiales bacterium]